MSLCSDASVSVPSLQAFLRYHALDSTPRPIPFTHVRTLSNWMVQPVNQVQSDTQMISLNKITP